MENNGRLQQQQQQQQLALQQQALGPLAQQMLTNPTSLVSTSPSFAWKKIEREGCKFKEGNNYGDELWYSWHDEFIMNGDVYM